MTGDELNEIVKGLTPEQREQLARGFGGEVVAWLNKNVQGWQAQTGKEKHTEAAITPKDSRLVFIIGVVAIVVVVLLAVIYRN
jgi:hypothetical protein